MTPHALGNRHGMVLVSSLLVLSVFFIHLNLMAARTMTERVVADQLRQETQALYLAHGAAEQLREELFTFADGQVGGGQAMTWLDTFGADLANETTTTTPIFDVKTVRQSGQVDDPDDRRDGVIDNPLLLRTLPTGQASAWITSIVNRGEDFNGNGALDIALGEDLDNDTVLDGPSPSMPRVVTVQATATVGTTTKTIRTACQIAPAGAPTLFRFIYNMQNRGWFSVNGDNTRIRIRGEVRSGGDISFGGSPSWAIKTTGDLYASQNAEQAAAGVITGGYGWYSAGEQAGRWYWDMKGGFPSPQRPERKLTFDGQPAINGTQKILPSGSGWDSDHLEPRRFEQQPPEDVPYIGALSYYESLAQNHGSTLVYYTTPGNPATKQTINQVYAGQDNIPGNADDTTVVLIGTYSQPLEINGPVVFPGDVIIAGTVKGQGTIYAGRNVHIIGDLRYQSPPTWPSLERNTTNGRIVAHKECGSNLGTVCNNGQYFPANAVLPPDCML